MRNVGHFSIATAVGIYLGKEVGCACVCVCARESKRIVLSTGNTQSDNPNDATDEMSKRKMSAVVFLVW